MKEVAREARTSISTVSNVVSGRRPVAPDTALRVQLAMKKLRFRPNALAQSLRQNRSMCLGFVIPDLSNPFFAKLLIGAEEAARRKGYRGLICSTSEIAKIQREAIEILESQRADGLLIAPAPGSEGVVAQLIDREMSFVLIDRYTGQAPIASLVTSTNTEGARDAVDHLIDLGHTDIAIVIGSPEISTSRERLEGYKQSLASHEIPIREELILQANTLEDAKEQVTQLLSIQSQATAVFGTNNPRVIGALIAIRELSLHCPNDISIVAFDSFDWVDAFIPPLTTVSQDPFQIGFKAATRLIKLLERTDAPESLFVERIPTELVLRDSTRSPRPYATPGGGSP